jgi:hypothetical protein
MNNYSTKAKFDNVKYDREAVEFHAQQFESGYRYPLAKACYQMIQTLKIKEENRNENNSTMS